jgi:DNA-binding transcriptional LysR family regulator
VAEGGTFTGAAARCFVTQSTLSTAIAQLERELGERLFVRTTRSVSLTPFGRQLLPLIEDVIAAQDRLVAAAEDYLDPDVKHVCIGICPLVDLGRIERLLTPYREANRSAEIVFEQLSGLDPRAALTAGRFDFLLGPAELKHARIERARLYDDELVYLAPGCAPSPDPPQPVRLRELASDTFLLVHDRCGLTIRTRQLFRAHRLLLNQYKTSAVTYSVLEEWACLGVGSAILPRSKVGTSGIGQSILLAKGQRALLHFEACWLAGKESAPHLGALAHHFKQASVTLRNWEEAPRAGPGSR